MKVKALVRLTGEKGKVTEIGEVVELPDANAKILIDAKAVEAVKAGA